MAIASQDVATALRAVGVIIIILCIVRRKQAIGGWLLYFLSQLLGRTVGVLMTLAESWPYLRPASWHDTTRYLLFVLSLAPRVAVSCAIAVAVVMLLRTFSWRWIERLRLLLICDVAAHLFWIGAAFHSLTSMRLMAVPFGLLSVITMFYFYYSKRVDKVFRTHDWGQIRITATLQPTD